MEKKKIFRFHAKQAALTYSSLGYVEPIKNIWLEEMCKKASSTGNIIEGYCIASEQHEKKDWHIHMWIKFLDYIDTKDSRFFDIDSIHPNIKNCGKSPIGWLNYIKKFGNFIENNTISAKEIDPSKGYIRKKLDKNSYEMDKKYEELIELEWPILYKNIKLEKPDPKNKKRHLWIWGKPTISKTKEMQDICEGKKVYYCPTESKYRWENYRNEEIVIFDDCDQLSVSELISVTETWRVRKEIHGGSRNYARFWPLNICRICIVLSNFPPIGDEAFQARFNEIHLKE